MASNNYVYGCVIDAGSSSSRLYIYRWHTTTQHSITKHYSHESSPGISHTHGIAALSSLLASAKSSLYHNDVRPENVPIYLGATAGMRILDPVLEASIVTKVRSVLRASGFRFRDEWARTISGEEESAYGWLVANYLTNGGTLPETHANTTYGALDLGGASAQISFRPTSGAILAHQFPLRVDAVEYSLYAHSFLYYGVDQAILRFHSSHYLDKNDVSLVSPCYPMGYKDPVAGIAGSSQWQECLRKVAALFDKTYDCYHGDGKSERCSFNGIYQPPLENKRFIAMSAFVYTWDFLGLRIGSDTEDLGTMAKRAKQVCSFSYKEQLEYYENVVKETSMDRRTKNIHAQCFNAAYAYHLLSTGFGLPLKNTPIEIHSDINGTRVQWALGMMLVERNKGSCEMSKQRSTIEKITASDTVDYKSFFMSLTPVFMLTTCVLVYLLQRARRKCIVYELYLPL
ncbi:hypothetical protein HJC23_004117 [Cyclotella cryptica]|uniref:Apyrase n=1 Tax=Cyclotella cryptica TaxID=29204 RepID=A0ABD3P975_9STRA|eukprot:CCRYP_016577-RA/>CCRYP_016577-RA protein AED:0.27 eAED:0.27 QI:2262/1/1/1/0/0/2/0/456